MLTAHVDKPSHNPLMIAITGGSGSGKSWLAGRLERTFRGKVARVSLDDFYRDRSHLSLARRARLNFDHPRAIDWKEVEHALCLLAQGDPAILPDYDFATHSRQGKKLLKCKPIIVAEGLWLLRRQRLRKMFGVRIFIECPASIRFRRRLARDLVSRRRTKQSIVDQFRKTVDPMHERFVSPQCRWADLILRSPCDTKQLRIITKRIRQALLERQPSGGNSGHVPNQHRPLSAR